MPEEIQRALKLSPQESGFRLYRLSISFIMDAPVDSIVHNRKKILAAVAKINLSNRNAIYYEIEALYAKRLMRLQDAKYFILKALNSVDVPQKQLLRLLTQLAYVNTDLEDYSGALESYKMIEKLLVGAKDIKERISNYVDEADLYTKAALFNESINSLNRALNLIHNQKGASVPILLYVNMAEAYFYLGNRDSLQYYTDKALQSPKKTFHHAIALHHFKYMELLLKKDPAAIDEIKVLISEPKDRNDLGTYLLLAKTYYEFDQTANAKKIAFKMLATGDLRNHKYLCSKLYKLLGDIYHKENNPELSSLYYKKSIEQTSLHIEKQLNSENMLVSLKYYDLKDKYLIAEKDLKVRKKYLVLLSVIAPMIIIILFLLYKSLQIRKKFNELRFNKLNEEISMMNSHEVRRYLANILGIITIIQISENKFEAYQEVERALCDSAENLDTSIKSIADKLNDKTLFTS
nr:hypothetical protein [Mucilaginibacter sp. SP1R1]MBB6148289.1 hypothetical protein [Mucilaginibacter sp. SP1R1]